MEVDLQMPEECTMRITAPLEVLEALATVLTDASFSAVRTATEAENQWGNIRTLGQFMKGALRERKGE